MILTLTYKFQTKGKTYKKHDLKYNNFKTYKNCYFRNVNSIQFAFD